jgi:Putative transmembrane protein (PGPGW)
MTQELKNHIRTRADAVQRHYHRRGPLFRAIWLVAAVLVVIAGLVMLVVPGPAIIVIPLGIAMLAARFRWAQILLRGTIEYGVTLHRRISKASIGVKILTVLAGGAVAATVAYFVWR